MKLVPETIEDVISSIAAIYKLEIICRSRDEYEKVLDIIAIEYPAHYLNEYMDRHYGDDPKKTFHTPISIFFKNRALPYFYRVEHNPTNIHPQFVTEAASYIKQHGYAHTKLHDVAIICIDWRDYNACLDRLCAMGYREKTTNEPVYRRTPDSWGVHVILLDGNHIEVRDFPYKPDWLPDKCLTEHLILPGNIRARTELDCFQFMRQHPLEKIEIKRCGNQIIAESYSNGTLKYGMATCSPDDTFDIEKGIALAVNRMLSDDAPSA